MIVSSNTMRHDDRADNLKAPTSLFWKGKGFALAGDGGRGRDAIA